MMRSEKWRCEQTRDVPLTTPSPTAAPHPVHSGTVPPQLCGVLPVTLSPLLSVTVPPLLKMPPPLATLVRLAWFPVTRLAASSVTVLENQVKTPAPLRSDVFPVTRLLISSTVPKLAMPPPSAELVALLPVMVHPVSVKRSAVLRMPAPNSVVAPPVMRRRSSATACTL